MRSRFAVLLFAISLLGQRSHAEDWKPITAEDLKYTEPGVSAVILYESEEADDTHSSRQRYRRIKILSEEGKKYATVEIPYNRGYFNIGQVRARTIRPDGSVVPFDGKVYEKTVVKAHGLKILEKAFTLTDVQVGSIIEYRYSIFWEDLRMGSAYWIVQDDLKKLHAHYSFRPYTGDVRTSHGYVGRGVFWTSYLPNGVQPVQHPLQGDMVDVDLTNVPAFQEEEFMPPADQMKYRVMFFYAGGRNLINVDQFWKDEAKMWNKEVNGFLSSGSAVAALVSDAGIKPEDTPEIKAKKIYLRVQKLDNLTYQHERSAAEEQRSKYKPPKNAEDVAKAGLGTRTDITRLYVAAARAAGLKAYAMEVSTRDEFIFMKQIPSTHQLNSEIAIVDLGDGKELFLDPGTAYCPFKLLYWKRTAVEGIRQTQSGEAVFAQTPMPNASDAFTVRIAHLTLKEDGSATGELIVGFRGQEGLIHRLQYSEVDEAGKQKDLEDEVREWLPPGSDLKLTKLENADVPEEPLIASFSVQIPQLGSAVGKRMLLPAGVLQMNKKQVLAHSQRHMPIYFSYPYREIDQVHLKVPPTIKVDTVPQKKDISNGGMVYRANLTSTPTELSIDRDFAVLGVGFPLDFYPQMKSFFESVKASDDEQVVLKAAPTVAAGGGN
jgi:uncharacterized protein DUF3857/transglutaminase superfamily protein